MADENKIQHLEMIQDIINRMAHNSFMLKGWTVTLVVGFFALLAKDNSKTYFTAIYIPIFMFWVLDSYYLLQERLYRCLYDKVRQKTDGIDYSLHAPIEISCNTPDAEKRGIKFLRCLHLEKAGCRTKKLASCLFSITEAGFYVPLILLASMIFLIH